MKKILILPFVISIIFIGYNKKVYFSPEFGSEGFKIIKHSINSTEFPHYFLKPSFDTISNSAAVYLNFIFFASMMAFSAIMVIKIYFRNTTYLKFSINCYKVTYTTFVLFLIFINILPYSGLTENLLIRFRNLIFTPIIEMILFLGFFFVEQGKLKGKKAKKITVESQN